MKKKSKQKKTPAVDMAALKEELKSFLQGFTPPSPKVQDPDNLTWFETINNEHQNPETLMAKCEQAFLMAEGALQKIDALNADLNRVKGILARLVR
jgi:hypothetical protein